MIISAFSGQSRNPQIQLQMLYRAREIWRTEQCGAGQVTCDTKGVVGRTAPALLPRPSPILAAEQGFCRGNGTGNGAARQLLQSTDERA